MGPDNPWSPDWQPDPSGRRLATIRLAGRGALLAGAVFVPVASIAAWLAGIRADLAALAIVVGAAGVALLGAGLAPAVVGSRIDAVVVGLAFAIGAPVAAVLSMLIAAIPLSALAPSDADLAGFVLSGGVLLAVRVAPLVAVASAVWVVAVRLLGPARPPTGR
jgi:hypothetical protein